MSYHSIKAKQSIVCFYMSQIRHVCQRQPGISDATLGQGGPSSLKQQHPGYQLPPLPLSLCPLELTKLSLHLDNLGDSLLPPTPSHSLLLNAHAHLRRLPSTGLWEVGLSLHSIDKVSHTIHSQDKRVSQWTNTRPACLSKYHQGAEPKREGPAAKAVSI